MAYTPDKIFKSIVAFFIPPLAVFIVEGKCDGQLLLNVFLTVLAYIPGLIHALYLIWKA